MGQLFEGTRAQVVFFSLPSVAGENTEMNRKAYLINTLQRGWCHLWNSVLFIFVLFFFYHRTVYMVVVMLETDRVLLPQRGKSILDKEFPGLIEKALN